MQAGITEQVAAEAGVPNSVSGILLLLLSIGFILFSSAEIAGKASGAWMIPVLNILIAAKVAIGSRTLVLLFIRHRGLL